MFTMFLQGKLPFLVVQRDCVKYFSNGKLIAAPTEVSDNC